YRAPRLRSIRPLGQPTVHRPQSFDCLRALQRDMKAPQKAATKRRRSRRRNKNLRDLRLFVVDFRSFSRAAHYDVSGFTLQLINFGSSASSNSNDGSSSSTLQTSNNARGTSVTKRDGRCKTV